MPKNKGTFHAKKELIKYIQQSTVLEEKRKKKQRGKKKVRKQNARGKKEKAKAKV